MTTSLVQIQEPLKSHYSNEGTQLTRVLYVKRKDNQEFGFTVFNRPLTYDDGIAGPILYDTATGVDGGPETEEAGFKADQQEIETIVADSEAITEDDLLRGAWNGAEFRYMEIMWSDLIAAPHILLEGKLGRISFDNGQASIRMAGLLESTSRKRGRKGDVPCQAPFGDPKLCGVQVNPNAWQSTMAVEAFNPRRFKDGDHIRPSTELDIHLKCVTTGTTSEIEPAWNTTKGAQTSETLTTDVWAASTAYPIGKTILANGLIWKSSGGTSDTVEPIWGSDPGDTVVDNDITWTAFLNTAAVWEAYQAKTVAVTVAVQTDRRTLILNTTTEMADENGKKGLFFVDSGANAGEIFEIRVWTNATKTVEFQGEAYFDFQPTDAGRLQMGCSLSKSETDGCRFHENILNMFMAFWMAPDPDQVVDVRR